MPRTLGGAERCAQFRCSGAARCADKANAKAQALKPPAPCVLPCTRRWAALFASIGRLNAEYSDSQIHNNLEELSRALHTLLYRIRLLFAKPHEGAVFHIVNVRHVVSAARAADAAPVRTQLSSEVLPQNSGGLGADAMAICAMFEATLELARAQYRDEVLSSHVKELVAYVAKAHGLTKAGREPRELREALGDVPKARVRRLRWTRGAAALWGAPGRSVTVHTRRT